MNYTYQTKGTCSTRINFELDGETVRNVRFDDGCGANLEAISRLVEGKAAGDVIRMLSGINCRNNTSCTDQLSRALSEALAKEPTI